MKTSSGTEPSTTRLILGRFAHLLSAQGVEGLGSLLFFVYLAWLDAAFYGEVMYALAAAAIVTKLVQFGTYYPLVKLLAEQPERCARLLNLVTVIKSLLLIPALIGLAGLAFFQHLTTQSVLILFLVSLGGALQGIAETFFADLRVNGRQDQESRIKMLSAITCYGFGFLAAAAGAHPVVVSLFMLVSGATRMGLLMPDYLVRCRTDAAACGEWNSAWPLFRESAVYAGFLILGLLFNKTNVFFLQNATGMEGVALYSAAYSLVEPVSTLASEQFLTGVVFPLLAGLWVTDPERAARVVRANAQWMLAIAFPIMFALHAGSDLLVGLIYPDKLAGAAELQRTLVWAVVLSFENNLFCQVMMVAGAARTLVVICAATLLLNLVLNILMVPAFGLYGGCLVIVLSKLIITIGTFGYCQFRFRFFQWGDFVFPVLLAAAGLAFFLAVTPFLTHYPAAIATLALYLFLLWKYGRRHMGAPPRKSPVD